MNKTKIEWCDMTWNPVTGCLHNCPYCYARRMANRFKGEGDLRENKTWVMMIKSHYEQKKGSGIYDIRQPLCRGDIPKLYAKNPAKISPYPFGFSPTFHRYRLEEPQLNKKPQNIFVCSMADLFGDWVPDEWIEEVFKACEKAQQHRYIFLTKNPKRYVQLSKKGLLPIGANYWYGTSVETAKDEYWYSEHHNFFVSIEPIMSDFTDYFTEIQRIVGAPLFLPWVIVGAETGNRKEKVNPRREWIADILAECRRTRTPIFMKDSLLKIWGEPLVRQFPLETAKNEGDRA